MGACNCLLVLRQGSLYCVVAVVCLRSALLGPRILTLRSLACIDHMHAAARGKLLACWCAMPSWMLRLKLAIRVTTCEEDLGHSTLDVKEDIPLQQASSSYGTNNPVPNRH